MKTIPLVRAGISSVFFLSLWFVWAVDAPLTGPQTEKRFPPLQVPAGFKANLYACDPLIEYPSVIAVGPRLGSLFVGIDYMTGLGTDIVKRSEVRLLEDTNDDGYADRASVYADGFNSIQGLAYHEGTVYVMHAPFLTALRDTDGDGKADERRDLLRGLGLPPEQNPVRLHSANGVVVGHDGWLYLAVGDHGVQVPRPEGDELILRGGGILRCRPNGRNLHVFATGLRNVYDIALDEELNVFLRDNENDGGDYMVRFLHGFYSADHGYPYLYAERPDEAVPPLADLGRGSSAGGICYLETAFPPEYRGNVFFCEWGRSVVRYRPQPAGATFAPVQEIEFATGADHDPYGFKPTDIVVDRAGTMFVSDYADGQRPKRGRGRIYRIVAENAPKPLPLGTKLEHLNSASYAQRCEAQAVWQRQGRAGLKPLQDALAQNRLNVPGRLHAVWILARVAGREALPSLFELARTDPDPRVRAQAVKAIADLTDPRFIWHRLEAGRGDAQIAEQLAALAKGQDACLQREVILALGRLRWAEAPAWLAQTLRNPDPVLAHAAMQTLRRCDNWPGVLHLLDQEGPIRGIALRALADQLQPEVIDHLLTRLPKERDPERKCQYADLLTRVCRQPGPWTYWGYRPPPRPANSVVWEATANIEQALNQMLADPDLPVRLAVLRRMQREKIPAQLTVLVPWLAQERDAERVKVLLEALRSHPAEQTRELLSKITADKSYPEAARLAALSQLADGLDASHEKLLLELAGAVEEGPVLAETLRSLGKRLRLPATPLLLSRTASADARVRAAALEALTGRRAADAAAVVGKLLNDADARVRQAAATAASQLAVRSALDTLLQCAARDPDAGVRRASLEALRQLREPRVVPLAVAALTEAATQAMALACIGELGGPEQASAVMDLARRHPSVEVVLPVVRMVSRWSHDTTLAPERRQELERAIAELQASSGLLARWHAVGPLTAAQAAQLRQRVDLAGKHDEPRWQPLFGMGGELRVVLPNGQEPATDVVWLAYTDLDASEPLAIQLLGSSSGSLHVWLNGRLIFERAQASHFQLNADRFEGQLAKGANRLLLQVASTAVPQFHLHLRRKSSTVEQERLIQAALVRDGNAERGRQLFFNVEKTQCLKCHRLGQQGEAIGPDLTRIGSRFARIYLIESILEPSRTIAPSYETQFIALKDGKVLTGVKVAETDDMLTLADNQGQKHIIVKNTIEERRALPQSTMPDGLEKKLTPKEFIDLIAFLVSQK